MNTNSSKNSRSSCFLFELCAREAMSLGAIGHGDKELFSSREGSFFLKRSSEGFFLKNDAKMEPQMASKRSQNLIKNELAPLDLQETRFRMERLPKITKIRGADKYNKQQKMCRNEANIHEKSVLELNKKRCLKTELNKNEKFSKKNSKMDQKK